MNEILRAIIIALLIFFFMVGFVFLMMNYQENCEKVERCYKAVGSSFGPSYLEIDCSSNNVDRTRMRCSGYE